MCYEMRFFWKRGGSKAQAREDRWSKLSFEDKQELQERVSALST